jgi:hypothetical protein
MVYVLKENILGRSRLYIVRFMSYSVSGQLQPSPIAIALVEVCIIVMTLNHANDYGPWSTCTIVRDSPGS